MRAVVWSGRSETWMPARGRANIVVSMYLETTSAACAVVVERVNEGEKLSIDRRMAQPLLSSVMTLRDRQKPMSGTAPALATACPAAMTFRSRGR
jgi:hypothetical protein